MLLEETVIRTTDRDMLVLRLRLWFVCVSLLPHEETPVAIRGHLMSADRATA